MSRARDTADQINRVNSSAADATAITVTSSEKIGIGTDAPTGKLTVRSGVGGGEALTVSSSSSGGNYVTHKHYSSGDIAYIGAGGGAAVSAGTSNDYAIRANSGSLIFATGGNNERARFDGDGLKFHGDTAAANALNDYEEGTWTPVDGSGQVTITGATGVYTRVGRQVTVIGAFTYPSTSQTNYAIIAGLPFSVSNYSDAVYASGSVQTSYIPSTNKHLAPLAYKNNTHFYFYGAESALTNADFSTRNFRINITYFTDQ